MLYSTFFSTYFLYFSIKDYEVFGHSPNTEYFCTKSREDTTNVLISAAGLCGATIIGAILGFFIKGLPHKWNDTVVGILLGFDFMTFVLLEKYL